MSRNSDRANTVLFRLQEQRAEANGYIDYNSTQRPRNVKQVKSLKDCENWRKQVLKEINEKLIKIQDEKLSDYQVRDLNDELNKLMKERLSWEYRIKELGGVNYLIGGKKGNGGVVIRGYTYFGRAKELKGVKELILKQKEMKANKENDLIDERKKFNKLKELQERVGLEYYGYYDEVVDNDSVIKSGKEVWDQAKEILGDSIEVDQDGVNDSNEDDEPKQLRDKLLKFERRATKKRIKQLQSTGSTSSKDIISVENSIPLTKQQISDYLIQRRKEQLLNKYNLE